MGDPRPGTDLAMTTDSLSCPACRGPLADLSAEALGAMRDCPRCGRPLEVTLLPAFGRGRVAGRVGVDRMGAGEAACFFHASKRAETACDQCGRFVCALCHLDLEGRNLCPACVGSGRSPEGGAFFERERTRWDIVTGWLVWLPLLSGCFWVLSPFTLLVAAGIALWKWRSPPSRIRNSRAWMLGHILAGVLLVVVLAVLMSGTVSHALGVGNGT